MSSKALRIATRKSPLAMKQTEMVKQALLHIDPSLNIELLPLQTKGDTFLNQNLSKIGGKGLFVKELEHAMLDNAADMAVHSMKDVPYQLPGGLGIHAILEREDARDAFISDKANSIQELPDNARIGTSSLRRASQLLLLTPKLIIEPLRGNINTRLNKRHNFDAIILAAAGLNRMNFNQEITTLLPTSELLPAAGQGALGIECRNDDRPLIELLSKLSCETTRQCVLAERAVITTLQGSCQVPLAAYCQSESNKLTLRALVARHDGSELITASESSNEMPPVELGKLVAKQLLDKGAQAILDEYV